MQFCKFSRREWSWGYPSRTRNTEQTAGANNLRSMFAIFHWQWHQPFRAEFDLKKSYPQKLYSLPCLAPYPHGSLPTSSNLYKYNNDLIYDGLVTYRFGLTDFLFLVCRFWAEWAQNPDKCFKSDSNLPRFRSLNIIRPPNKWAKCQLGLLKEIGSRH